MRPFPSAGLSPSPLRHTSGSKSPSSVSPPLNLQMSGIAFKMVQVCSSHTSREHSYRYHSDKQHMLAFITNLITKHPPIPTCCGCRSCIERTIFFVPAQMVNPCRIMLRACACGVSPQAVELPPPPAVEISTMAMLCDRGVLGC